MININSFCFGYLGVQKHGGNFMVALSRYDEIALFPWDIVPPQQYIPPFFQQCLLNAKKASNSNIGLGIGVMNRMPYIVGGKKIAFTVWETSQIPPTELKHLQDVDEIWMPSTWGKTLLEQNGINSDRVKVVPEGVNTQRYKPRDKEEESTSHRRFRFLCVGKWEKRKGIDILLRAYANTFRTDEPVELVLHCYNPQIPDFHLKAAIAQLNLPPHPPIRYSPPVTESAMVDIYNNCDAFVLLSRAEGWGLPIIEAMACAKPVIVTDYSGYRDFVNSSNGYLVKVKKMVKVKDPQFFSSELDYGEWAEPDSEHLQWVLRYVFEHPQEARNIGTIAREDVVKSWTWNHAAYKAWKQL
ncbi:MAG: glycosyltransferase family 4 protein [Symploca sp. SIO1C2]|nr:glycosyltransferase family 4 protein [Symploca sp. SIO1C2]